MESTIFDLNTAQLKEIAKDLQRKIEVGLEKDNTEISCIPTYVSPKKSTGKEKILVLDWGGTNFRVAIVEFTDGQPKIVEHLKKSLSKDETKGFFQSQLFKEMADLIDQLKNLDNKTTSIGYCFSYPAESTLTGDAILLRWTKEITIPEMIGKLVGKSLLDYLNNDERIKAKTIFNSIKVVNDTVACLFAGLAEKNYDTYIGLIVGTGTNMAALIRPDKIQKLSDEYKNEEPLPVNLESGNLIPSPHTPLINKKYLTEIDEKVDENSTNKGHQIFEKAISGRYLGEIFKHSFPNDKMKENFDAESLADIMNNSTKYPEQYALVARRIYTRSAHLVSASIAGLIIVLASHDKSIKNICVAAEGGLFWGEQQYSQLVSENLHLLLTEFGLNDIQVKIAKTADANLTGSAIAALS